jgi:glutathione S-transferase
VIDQAARHAVVDYDAPITGSRPLQLLKRTVKLLTAWYMIFVGRQLVAFAGTSLRALRILGGRIDTLEQRTPAVDPRIAANLGPVSGDVDLTPWHTHCIEAFAQAPAGGRVVHAECGDGAFLAALRAAGIDAYGVDPRRDAAAVADEQLVEVRGERAREHLASLASRTARGILLSGCVDRYVLGDQIELADTAAAALVPGGVLVIIGRDPAAWVHDTGAITADLAPGRPLHAATWRHLLQSRAFDDVVSEFGARAIPDDVARSADPAVAAIAATLFPPVTYCIIARRR